MKCIFKKQILVHTALVNTNFTKFMLISFNSLSEIVDPPPNNHSPPNCCQLEGKYGDGK